MDYRTIINEQIEKLQAVQGELCMINKADNASKACEVARTIEFLCGSVTRFPVKKEAAPVTTEQPEELAWTNLRVDQSKSGERMTFSEMEARGILGP